MTNLYAKDKSNVKCSTNANEMRLFLAMLLLSGYYVILRIKLYWEQKADVHCAAMSSAMSRNRFELLKSVFHLCDNKNLDLSDKMAKIRPFYDKINKRCLQYHPNCDDLSVDESMIPYYGRNSSKQCLQNKPLHVGHFMFHFI